MRVRRTSHRRFVRLAAAAAVVAVAGCGGSTDAQTTRAYTDATGRAMKVPAEPQRIVALSEPTLDAALALGVKPVGTTLGRGQGTIAAYLQGRTKGIESVGILAQPNIERIARLRPDLILSDGTATLDDATLDKLERFAPTAVVGRNGGHWRTTFENAADVMGRKDEGAKLLKTYDTRIASIRSRLGANRDATISIVRWGGIGLPAIIKEDLSAGSVLKDIGLKRPPAQSGRGPGHTVPVSLENIEYLDGDWLFFGSLGAGGGAAGGTSDTPADLQSAKRALSYAADTPGFRRLKAFRTKRIVPVDGSVWTSAGGYLAEQVVLNDIERTLATPAKQ